MLGCSNWSFSDLTGGAWPPGWGLFFQFDRQICQLSLNFQIHWRFLDRVGYWKFLMILKDWFKEVYLVAKTKKSSFHLVSWNFRIPSFMSSENSLQAVTPRFLLRLWAYLNEIILLSKYINIMQYRLPKKNFLKWTFSRTRINRWVLCNNHKKDFFAKGYCTLGIIALLVP